MTTLYTAAAAAEIERLTIDRDFAERLADYWFDKYIESERQRKILAEQLERLCRAGIDAAVGAGK